MKSLSFIELKDAFQTSKSVNTLCTAVKEENFPIEIEGSEGSLTGILIAAMWEAKNEKSSRGRNVPKKQTAVSPVPSSKQFFVIVTRETDADELALDLAESGISVMKFPWWGTAPYRELSPHSAIFAERVKIQSELVLGKDCIVIIPQRALLSPLTPPDYIKSLLIIFSLGDKIDTGALAKKLVSYGYIRVPRVQVQGEFAMRGEVLDIFMGGGEGEAGAYRVLFDFDTVENIKRFDPARQVTVNEKLSSFTIYPMKEVVWTDDRIETLQKNISRLNEFNQEEESQESVAGIIDELITKRAFQGEEMFYPLAFEKAGTLLDYLGGGTLILVDKERLESTQDSLYREYQSLYMRAKREGCNYPLPERILLNYDSLISSYAAESPRRKIISFRTLKGKKTDGVHNITLPCEGGRSFFGNIEYLNTEISGLLRNGWQIAVAAESRVQAERIKKMFESLEGVNKNNFFIMSTPLTAGFSLPDIKFMVIQENEIFGRRKRAPRSLKTVRSSPIDTFIELNLGDYIVHVNHGIGLFKGIERLIISGHERDYIHIVFADEESVFVPVEQVNLIQRYIGSYSQLLHLDTIGSKNWEKRKGKVKEAVEKIAEELIELYSKRKKAQGFAFERDSEWQTMFEAAFPFEETEDQITCTAEIKKDMEKPIPMDRLVCGDVGYGKTEVAMRACFKAVMAGKQVAFLAPTTILAEQHYENFLERFSRFPVNIAILSRFVDKRKTRIILKQLKRGEIDLLVGTHRIIQKDTQFKNLGFLVIDEEQRFGVKAKERFKELKTNIDCLSLSATPIPRTLHMSLVKIRDMSILGTAPFGRRPIETFVEEFNANRIAKAVRAEVERGGQVFFLHNRVETLRDTRVKLEKLLPEILIEIAHGQMEAQDLEDVMRRFIFGGFHVLVSTTIIENGIDIPNVNTIIIDRADMYGVSQLYQLRGRVGRSDRTAYAYLFYPHKKTLSEIAMKRLQTISDFTDLGSGFKIAMKDMEIRGTGNLLGHEQSGSIYAVGFELYLKLLEQAVKKLEDSDYEAETEPLLELEYSGFIPDTYIDSPQEKMEIYKMIAGVIDKEELDRVYYEITDRFGPLPDEAASLLALAEIRIICRQLAVLSLREGDGIARIEFAKVSRMKVDRLLRMIKESSGRVKIDPKKPNVILLATGSIGLKEKSEFIREKLSVLV